MAAIRINPQGRYHFSGRPVRRVVQRPYVQGEGMKPHGFWYSLGSEWRDWTQNNMPSRHRAHVHVTKLDIDTRRILKLDTPEKIRFFHSTTHIAPRGVGALTRMHISWRKIERAGYAGVEIAPYQWSMRFDMEAGWYYGWDVASGCIWDVSAIRKVTYLGAL